MSNATMSNATMSSATTGDAITDIRRERLSELVTQLTGAPLDRSRCALAEAMDRNRYVGDSLTDVADALVAIRSATA